MDKESLLWERSILEKRIKDGGVYNMCGGPWSFHGSMFIADSPEETKMVRKRLDEIRELLSK